MGCDIHFRVEFYGPDETVVLNDSGEVTVAPSGDCRWQPAERLTPNEYIDMYREMVTQGKLTEEQFNEVVRDEGLMNLSHKDRFYTGRNYALFYKLSGVRGPYDHITPIPGPDADYHVRPFPEDVSPEVMDDIGDTYGDLHSHGWYTLTELLATDWGDMDGIYGAGPGSVNYTFGGSGFGDTILSMQAVAIEKCNGNTDHVRCLFSYDN